MIPMQAPSHPLLQNC